MTLIIMRFADDTNKICGVSSKFVTAFWLVKFSTHPQTLLNP